MPTGSMPSQTDSIAPASPVPSANTVGQPFAAFGSVTSFDHLRQAGRANEADAAAEVRDAVGDPGDRRGLQVGGGRPRR